jgi:hypothetical protein
MYMSREEAREDLRLLGLLTRTDQADEAPQAPTSKPSGLANPTYGDHGTQVSADH